MLQLYFSLLPTPTVIHATSQHIVHHHIMLKNIQVLWPHFYCAEQPLCMLKNSNSNIFAERAEVKLEWRMRGEGRMENIHIFYCTIHQWKINHRKSIKVKYDSNREFEGSKGKSQILRWISRLCNMRSFCSHFLMLTIVSMGMMKEQNVKRTNILPFVEWFTGATKILNCPMRRFVTIDDIGYRLKGFQILNWNV